MTSSAHSSTKTSPSSSTDCVLATSLSSPAPVLSLPSNFNPTFASKLRGRENIIPCKLQFQPLFNYFGLNLFLDGTEVTPQIMLNPVIKNQEPNPAYQAWYNKDQLLFAWLLSSITESIFTHLIGLNSGYAAWTALNTAYGTISNAQHTTYYGVTSTMRTKR